MLAQLKRASRHGIALIWAMALVFAVAPTLAMAYVTPAGAFSRFLMHAHEHGDEDHVHHGDHHHGHFHTGDEDHHHHDGVDDGQPDDPGQPRLHVHFDVCCPSVLVPILAVAPLQERGAGRVTAPRVDPLQGAPPDLLLRPPIPSFLS
jgi:hypothetical protein